MSEDWDQYAEEWDSKEDVNLYSEKAYNILLETVEIENLNILDFGCGTGLLTEKMAPIANRILAVDSSERMISVLNDKELNNVITLALKLSEETIKVNKLLQSKFDLIVASSVCAFLPDFEKVLRLLKTLLAPNGIFIQWDWKETEKDPGFGFTKNRIKSAFIESGFQILSITEPFSLTSKDGEMKVIMGVAKNA
jgi:predicted TPR repeat methyltransferase